MTCRESRGCYVAGCRNQTCREANATWKREYKAKRRLAKDTYPPSNCGVCSSPISDHQPYFRHVRTA